MEQELKYQPKDYKSDQYVRWCPGCGDHAVLNCVHKAMAELNVDPKDIAVISGIGCSSRLPYYMNSYGFHTIHGRGAAIATGVKTANPALNVWLMTGDGDCLAIGGNHFIHAVRRNIDLNIVLFNNKIYGLTKGQYSPTTDRGFVTKSSPYGTVEEPFIPAELTFGARGNFFARVIDVDLKNTTDILTASARHKGASVVEVLVNCVIFNDGIHKQITDKEFRPDRTIFLRHGEKMLFGKENEKGLVLDGLKLKVVTIGQDGYTLDDILVHDAHTEDATMHMMLGMMGGDLPLALGVIRDVDAPCYDQEVEKQILEVQAKKPHRTLNEFLMSGEIWEVK
ncbi:2-oxoglutarate ferredoxin oxidoreductase subunit beta [Parabacteroides sp. PF5-5]|uniref:2-oxoacid:ferredoxin oxidoreductase subunit beta n=1 Tax=unclassified Parabacteroides TaxID=2649774 RepID=UPI00247368E0|nr:MULTISPECIES: 2-oxoacid:ferredoxin oxidoreductase subunit beta [unclassified Parabacteroides]MDH6305996.1 2-oxoglutarate ferredoxin oxidoreductase subunit beta [Parabacteroides sp. PH5-39]MDH6317252.1 2-oxoglutarate ferredoxin oxidoreductase subunit beta [Parabacteroides sp. PF5-13]MDH6320708.1 2-oxoglutarate ferredoxin oxidoreductase subunit beta [Parabacteroides sp. PH5-13]MDH6324371.1 2-oxoglutarate ferredoxin oxidoreductase subunit beta [Parabacteroides sp. PH5-8]MDH6328437.1 2-oxogluta